ncbi:cytotoxic translational repressor of toxin-antitoxin stability system [Amycolatopsis sp. WAC 04182]|uniref:cytotoxic translational repressor of toxin-antitoxin stability system n=1 Tax=Amycolatopsis sp. WAC 04182 TaxID=2203198 RepID=UPI000F79C32B|nr:cytotoxic translational repressor of toxin-antitoxin stability system [Amycolatopsis sp. WAC 04182]RSN65870.1 cytotoxic translational repressor of toxin-antitoxin stability system [Amycolatopsis sp. WAC 04182]
MNWPQPTRKDHESFCQVEEWRRVRDARGRTGTHHVTYELGLMDGRILRTRISHPVDRTGYGKSIWKHILRDQLDVDEPCFWSCVHDGVKPDRGLPAPQTEALPADLVHMLLSRVGLAESEVAAMSKAEAIARLQQFWTENG